MNESVNRDDHQEETCSVVSCPVCLMMRSLHEARRKHSDFFSHLYNAQIELLQAFRSIIDCGISSLEQRKDIMASTKKAAKIEVE